MVRTVFAALAVAVAAWAVPAWAAEPLVTVDWVKANLGKPGVVFLDTRPKTDYLRGHVPGAVGTDYAKDGWREDNAQKTPDMFPEDPAKLAQHIGSLGIGNDSHVVVLPPGANSTDMGMGTRIYWTFKVLGHDAVSILDGGMAAYTKDKANPLETGQAEAKPKSFAVALRRDMLVSRDDMKKALDAGALLVDNRTEDQYAGINRHPRAKASGTIPGAKNLPQSWLTDNGGGSFRDKATLESLYRVAGVPTSGPQIAFCNTGHWASIGWFVSSELLGNKQTRLYDGSMVEWTADPALPVEQKVKF